MTEIELNKLTYVEQRVANESKSTGFAILLWFLFGTFGAHRFYLNRGTSAAILLLTNLIGIFCAMTIGNDMNKMTIAALCFTVVWVWWFIDLFLIPSLLRANKQELRETFSREMK